MHVPKTRESCRSQKNPCTAVLIFVIVKINYSSKVHLRGPQTVTRFSYLPNKVLTATVSCSHVVLSVLFRPECIHLTPLPQRKMFWARYLQPCNRWCFKDIGWFKIWWHPSNSILVSNVVLMAVSKRSSRMWCLHMEQCPQSFVLNSNLQCVCILQYRITFPAYCFGNQRVPLLSIPQVPFIIQSSSRRHKCHGPLFRTQKPLKFRGLEDHWNR